MYKPIANKDKEKINEDVENDDGKIEDEAEEQEKKEKKEKNDKFYSESYSKISESYPSQTSPTSHLSYLIVFIYFDTSFDTPFIYKKIFYYII